MTIAGDVVYVADAAASKITAFSRLSGDRLGVLGAPGNALGQLNGPSGITAGADGPLYVVEQRNSRVQVFGPGPVPAADGVAPTVTWTGPANTTTSSAWPVAVGGRFSDPTGVAQVQVAVKDVGTGLLWDEINTRWGPWVWNQAVVSGPVEDGSWSYTLVPAVPGHRYQFTMQALDRQGAVSATFSRTLTFADTTAPTVAITSPVSGGALPRSAATVSDDLGPVSVTVGVENPATGQWWDPAAGAWSATPVLVPADAPSAPGALPPTQVGTWRWPLDTTPLRPRWSCTPGPPTRPAGRPMPASRPRWTPAT